MPNRLIHENSPYLLQHADNPVDWFPWGEEALEKAKIEDKPIFLSIGYAACHWCHVMEHESFEDSNTANLMNEHFVNIKVDREERPDLDNIYMQAVVAITRQGGWPMSVFLTPDGKPFYGGAYFPPVPRHNMPAFRDVLHSIVRLWQEDRSRLLQSAQEISQHIKNEGQHHAHPEQIDQQTLKQASLTLAQNYDWDHGGWGNAPKFPQPMAIEFLLQRAANQDKFALDIAEHALRAMAKGGMYDVVGGGFARYSVDNDWKVPHFEKMLYDNAQLARVYLHGYLLTGYTFYRRICEETLDFVLQEMTHPLGGFYSSLDADSEGKEGKYYIWDWDEIQELDWDTADRDLLISAYGISESGNFEGSNILQRVLNDEEISAQFGLDPQDVPAKLVQLHARLLGIRTQRISPNTDDKILTSWNGLMLIAFAEAGRYLKSNKYLKAAIRNATFLGDEIRKDGQLYRAWRKERANHNAYLEDYAALILGLLTLYQSDPEPRWYAQAIDLASEMISHFSDPAGGFFDTRDDHEKLLFRPKDIQDNATPSGNALAAQALLQLSAFNGNGEWRDLAEAMLHSISEIVPRYPTGFAQWLCAMDFALAPTQEVALLGESESSDFQALTEVLWERYRPHLVAALSSVPPAERSPELLANRPLVDQKATAYVCQNFVCQKPTTKPADLRKQLEKEL